MVEVIQTKTHLLQVLRIRPFTYLWITQVLTQISVNMLVFILAVLVYEKTRSNTAVSLLFVTVGLPAALFGAISGVVVDRMRKRQALLLSTLVRAILIGLVFFYRHNIGYIYILVALISTVSQLFVPAEASLIPKFVPQHLLLSANSLFTMTFYSAIIGGFVAGGPLLSLLGTDLLLVSLVLTFVIAWLMLLLLPGEKNHVDLYGKFTFPHLLHDLRSGIGYIVKIPVVVQAILLLTLAQAIIAIIATLGPGFADRVLLIKLTDASVLILGPAAAGMVVGAIFVGSVGMRFRKKWLINTGIFLSSLLLLLVAFLIRSRSYHSISLFFEEIFSVSLERGLLPLSVLSFFFMGFANSLIDVSCNTVLQEQTSDQVRGRVYGILQSLIGGVAILPVVVSGVVADLFGVGKIIFVLGLTLLFFGIYTSRGEHLLQRVFGRHNRN